MKFLAPIAFALAIISNSWAVSPTPTSKPAPSQLPACVAPEFRQFDFWLGHWRVTDPKGNQVGISEISRVSEGCAIREQWTSASGQGGTSINYYDADDHQWHQDWVGATALSSIFAAG